MFSLAVQEMFRHQTTGSGLVCAAPLPSEAPPGHFSLKPSASAEFGVRGKQFLPLLSHGRGFFPVGILMMDDANDHVSYKPMHTRAVRNHLSLWDSLCLFAAAAAGASQL